MSTLEPVSELPQPRAESAVVRALAFLGPDFTFFLFFLGVFIALGLIFGGRFHVAGEGSIVIVTGLAAGLVGVRFFYRAHAIVMNTGDERAKFYAAARRILRDWGPMILLVVVFENLHSYTGLIRKIRSTTSSTTSTWRCSASSRARGSASTSRRRCSPTGSRWRTACTSSCR